MLACAAALSGAAGAATPPVTSDEAKFRLLSCETGALSTKVVDWLNQFTTPQQDEGQLIPGPLTLGKACVKNVRVVAAFGAMVVQGEICNARLGDFTDALAGIGVKLGKEANRNLPGALLQMQESERTYMITDRPIDMRTGKPVPFKGKYAFNCTVRESGPQ